MQWAYGKNWQESEFAKRHLTGLDDAALGDFVRRQGLRDAAGIAFRKAKAEERLSQLSTARGRTPMKDYAIGDVVYIWRKWKGFKPRWFGPGRVVLLEAFANARLNDDRRRIVWVVFGRRLVRRA